jgi:glycosyltransferase involved in cell wall biosynthesis
LREGDKDIHPCLGMRYVLAPRPNEELFAQDYFVHDLSLFHKFTLLRNGPTRYPHPLHDPELIVSHNPDEPHDADFLADYGGRVPIVVHQHVQYEFLKDAGPANLRKALPWATIGVVPCNSALHSMRRNFGFVDWRVVHNGARKALYFPSAEPERVAFRAKLQQTKNIPEKAKLIGFVGRLEDAKGMQIVRTVAEQVGRIDAALLVQFPNWPATRKKDEDDRQRYLVEANRLERNLRGRFVAYPDQGPRLPNRVVRYFDVLLMPSLSEVQPMVVLEALASGVPLVATISSGFFHDLRGLGIDERECRLIPLPTEYAEGASERKQITDDRDLKLITDAILQELKTLDPLDDNGREELARKADRAGFTDSKMYAKYLNIYDEAVLCYEQTSVEERLRKASEATSAMSALR